MAHLARLVTRTNLPSSVLRCSLATSSCMKAQPLAPEFWKKNEELKRPLSPWMIYKFQLTSMLSITHRGTGLGLSVLLYGWGVQQALGLTLGSGGNWEQTLTWISATFPSWSLMTVKVLVATSVGYHLVNGIRHLLWDMGYGFTLKELYTSGYFVILLTAIFGVLAAYNA